MLPINKLSCIPQAVFPTTVILLSLFHHQFSLTFLLIFPHIPGEGRKWASSCVSSWLLARANPPHLKWKGINGSNDKLLSLITNSQKFLCCYWIHLDSKSELLPGREMVKLKQKITRDQLTYGVAAISKRLTGHTQTASPSS